MSAKDMVLILYIEYSISAQDMVYPNLGTDIFPLNRYSRILLGFYTDDNINIVFSYLSYLYYSLYIFIVYCRYSCRFDIFDILYFSHRYIISTFYTYIVGTYL